MHSRSWLDRFIDGLITRGLNLPVDPPPELPTPTPAGPQVRPGAYRVRESIHLFAWQIPAQVDREATAELIALTRWIETHQAPDDRGPVWSQQYSYAFADDGTFNEVALMTVSGWRGARTGDWIVCGPKGFFVRTAAEFEADYEPVDG